MPWPAVSGPISEKGYLLRKYRGAFPHAQAAGAVVEAEPFPRLPEVPRAAVIPANTLLCRAQVGVDVIVRAEFAKLYRKPVTFFPRGAGR